MNSKAQIVGLDTAASEGYSFSAQSDEGFAIPIDTAEAVAALIESGTASSTVHIGPTAFLGVLIASADAGGYGGYGGGASGATIAGVVANSPAAQAGLAEGDVITSLGGQTVDSADALSALIVGSYQPGDQVQVVWLDQSGQQHSTTVTLASGPAA